VASTSFHSLLEESEPLANRFRAEGRSLYLVGGIVRDSFLGQSGSDLDFDFTTDASPDEIERIIRSAGPVALWTQGKKFGTIGAHFSGRDAMRSYEVTTHRGDTYTGLSRKPEVVFGSSLEDDLARRDFTINAMAVDATTGALIDPFNGQRDLAEKRLRTPLAPEVSFSDDPLRMLRAGRFIARFGLTPTAELVAAASQLCQRLAVVSPERIRSEFDKLLILPDLEFGLRFLIATGLTGEFLPELAVGESVGRSLDSVGAPDQVSFNRLLRVLAECPPLVMVRFSGLFSMVIEPNWPFCATDSESAVFGRTRVKTAEARMLELRYSTHEISMVKSLVANVPAVLSGPSNWSAPKVRRVLHASGQVYQPMVQLATAMASVAEPDDRRPLASVRGFEQTVGQLRQSEDIERFAPDLDGDDVMGILGIAKGRIVGEALSFLLDLRLDEGVVGRAEATERLIAWANGRAIPLPVLPADRSSNLVRETQALRSAEAVREVPSTTQGRE
jgi:poly(A) polymerase